jgi:nucleoside-diphosphate-sugar epimerase
MKKVLLIAGGGTLGTYTAKELLNKGCAVDVICLEDYTSNNPKLCYHKAKADLNYLTEFLKDKYYDGIVNFIHYYVPEMYKPVHKLLTSKTDQLIFLSSYRVYAESKQPLTEEAPFLADVVEDEEFLKSEDYAVPKAICEKFLREESGTENWTVVRPVISFSDKRFDLVTVSGHEIIDAARSGKTVILPEAAKNLTAGLDWAGNSGKLIANLLFKKECLGEAYTVSSGQNLTWGEVADIYTRLTGVNFRWADTEEYVSTGHGGNGLFYDRLYDRAVDNTKILKATGLKNEDFTSIEDGIKIELNNIGF